MNSPTPEEIKKARLEAGLTQTQAELLMYHANDEKESSTLWFRYEIGTAKMKPAMWELFQLKLTDAGVAINSAMEIKPTSEEIKKARLGAGLTQTQAAKLIHKSLRVWQNYELGDRKMDVASWVLFQIKITLG
jgi:DNA-binding transcriptional regulator YiaG